MVWYEEDIRSVDDEVVVVGGIVIVKRVLRRLSGGGRGEGGWSLEVVGVTHVLRQEIDFKEFFTSRDLFFATLF